MWLFWGIRLITNVILQVWKSKDPWAGILVAPLWNFTSESLPPPFMLIYLEEEAIPVCQLKVKKK